MTRCPSHDWDTYNRMQEEAAGPVEVTMLDADQVMILIHENALEEMTLREVRLERRIHAAIAELDELRNDIRNKRFQINSARDALLRRTV